MGLFVPFVFGRHRHSFGANPLPNLSPCRRYDPASHICFRLYLDDDTTARLIRLSSDFKILLYTSCITVILHNPNGARFAFDYFCV